MKTNRIYIILLFFLSILCYSDLNAQSTMNTDFWVTFLPNTEDLETLSLTATGNNYCTGVVTNPTTGWSSSFNISPGFATSIIIPIDQAYDRFASDAIINRAVHITTTDSIYLYANNYGPFTVDITNVLPTVFLGSDYIVQTYIGNSMFSVIATEDNTVVNINLSGNSYNHIANSPFTVTLNAGQCYQVQSINIDTDLSGSTITANENKKIAVFAGNICNRVPHEEEGRDHMMEQMIPTPHWGNEFIITNSLLRTSDRVRVTALNNDCEIIKDGILLTTINARETYEFEITSSSPVTYLETSEPSSVFLYSTGAWYGGMDGDPSMVIVNPLNQRINKAKFSTYYIDGSQNHFINIVTNTNNVTNIMLNDNSISNTFNIVPSNPNYSYARIEINHGTYSINNISTNEENGFIAHIYGMRSWEAYSFSLSSMTICDSSVYQLIINGLNSFDYPDGFEICNHPDSNFTFDLNLSYIPSNVVWDFGDGEMGEGIPISHHYDEPGIYNVSCFIYKSQDSVDVLDNILSTILKIKPTYDTTITATICANDGYTNNGFNENETGIYIDTLHTIEGCDSIIRLNLTANPAYNDTIIGKICEGEVYDLYGFYGTHDTIITKVLQTQLGCDSIITLDLKVGTPYNDTIHATITEGEYYNEYGFHECEKGVYSRYSTSSYGCDSSLHLFLNVTLESDLYIPNCITPNLPTNNKFDIIHDEAFIIDDVYIYNRAGGLIFHSPNNTESWNGKYKGIPCPQASYTYIIYYHKERINERYEKVGTVLLLY